MIIGCCDIKLISSRVVMSKSIKSSVMRMPSHKISFVLKCFTIIDDHISFWINKQVFWNLNLKVTVSPNFIDFLNCSISSLRRYIRIHSDVKRPVNDFWSPIVISPQIKSICCDLINRRCDSND